MAIAYERIRSRLSQPAMQAVAIGGIYDRPLVRPAPAGRPANPGQTADAFDADGRVKPSIVVTDGPDAADPTGPDAAFNGLPTVWFYAQPTSQGKEAIAAMRTLAFGYLHGWLFPTDNGTGCEARVVGRLGVRDAPDDFPAVVDHYRIQVVFLDRATG